MEINEKQCSKIVKGVAPTTERPCIQAEGHSSGHQDAYGVKNTNHGPKKAYRLEWLDGRVETVVAHRMTYSGSTHHRDASVLIFWDEYTQARVFNMVGIKRAEPIESIGELVLNISGTDVKIPVALK